MLNSIFGADGYTSEKGRKTKGGKKKGRATGMYMNCLFKILLVT